METFGAAGAARTARPATPVSGSQGARSSQYHWLTALLAARDLQAVTCRTVATIIAGLGVIPLLLLAGPFGPPGWQGVVVATTVAACCAAMAATWLRGRWPSLRQSQTCVVVGALCISASVVTTAQPALGLAGCAGFVVLGAFTTCFHSMRLLQLVWLIAAGAVAVVVWRSADTDIAMAVASGALVVLTNVFVAFTCHTLVDLIDRTDHYGDIEPVTGLLTRDAFFDRVATLIHARSRDDDRYLVVLTVALDGFSVLAATATAAETDRARVAVGQRLREAVRSTAMLAHVGESEFLIADLFATADPSPLAERVRDCVATAPYRLMASVGALSTPLRPLADHSPVDACDELVEIATATMENARRNGGNQIFYAICPRLRILDAPPPGHWVDDRDASLD